MAVLSGHDVALRRAVRSISNFLPSETGDSVRADLALVVVGYEERSRHVPISLELEAATRVGMVYTEQRHFSFKENLGQITKAGYKCSEVDAGGFDSWFTQLLDTAGERSSGVLRLVVDISSMDRFRLSRVIWCLGVHPGRFAIDALFLYAPSRFTRPKPVGPVSHLGAVSAEFAGWSRHPEHPCDLMLGLGYEGGSALAAIELLEPSVVWPFMASGGAEGFDDAVLKANSELLAQIGREYVSRYDIWDPAALVTSLESLTANVEDGARPIFVPLGPKIFALASLVVAYTRFPFGAVWRLSPGAMGQPRRSQAAGGITGLRVTFEPAA